MPHDAQPMLSEDQQMIRAAVREFVQGELAPRARDLDAEGTFPETLLAEFAENGMLGIPFPEDLGGGDGDALSFVISIEELARVCAGTALTVAEHVGFVAWPIYRLGTDAQRGEWLPALLSGERLGSLAHGERRVGDSVQNLRTTAATATGGWSLDGAKSFVINGGRAGTMLVTAIAADNEMCAFVLPKDAVGVSIGERRPTMGVRAADIRDIALRAVSARESACLSGAPVAESAWQDAMSLGQAAMAAMALGIAEAAREQAAEYAQARRQFDTPIGKFPAIALKIADMAVGIDATRHLVYDAARQIDAGRNAVRAAATARVVAARTALGATYDAIQVYGGNGYSREYPLERHWRDAKLTALAHGTTESHLLTVADDVLPFDE